MVRVGLPPRLSLRVNLRGYGLGDVCINLSAQGSGFRVFSGLSGAWVAKFWGKFRISCSHSLLGSEFRFERFVLERVY